MQTWFLFDSIVRGDCEGMPLSPECLLNAGQSQETHRGTGNGHREADIAGMDFFTEWKVVYTDYSSKLQKAQIDE